MKARTVILIAAMALLATSCRYVNHVKDMVEDIANLPVTAENVAERAEMLGSDVALVVPVADTQYVLFRQLPQVFKKDSRYRTYTIRYVKTGDDDWSARIGTFHLDNPEQPVEVTRTGDNSLKLVVDCCVISLANIVATDTVLTFDFGIDEPDRSATLYLYGKARKMKDPLTETSIQQMLVLALSLDALIEETDSEVNEGLTEADSSLADFEREMEQAERALDQAGDEMERAAASKAYGNYYAEYSRLDSLASALGFANKESTADNANLYFKAWGGLGGSKKCYARMEHMCEVAGTCHTAGYSVRHKPHHRGCTFIVKWKTR